MGLWEKGNTDKKENENSSGFWSGLIHGTDGDGRDVTVAFGTPGTPREGHTLLADGHKDRSDFNGQPGAKGHDHYGRGDGPNDNGTQNRQYTGHGS